MSRWPLQPLLALGRTRDGDRLPMKALSARLGLCESTVQGWQRSGIPSDEKAEAAAVAIGFDPANVWGDAWTEAQIAKCSKVCVECKDTFVPFNAQQKFCTPRCQNRNSKRRRYWSSDAEKARKKAEAKRYYDECAEYVKAQKRRKYWANPQAEIERNKDYRRRKQAGEDTQRGRRVSTSVSGSNETVAA